MLKFRDFKMPFSSLQIVSSACVWAAEGLLRVWEFVFCLCAYRLETARERGKEWEIETEKNRKKGGRGRDWRQDGGWRAGSDYGLERLGGFVVRRFLNTTFLYASWGRLISNRRASARGIEQKMSSEHAAGHSLLAPAW